MTLAMVVDEAPKEEHSGWALKDRAGEGRQKRAGAGAELPWRGLGCSQLGTGARSLTFHLSPVFQ